MKTNIKNSHRSTLSSTEEVRRLIEFIIRHDEANRFDWLEILIEEGKTSKEINEHVALAFRDPTKSDLKMWRKFHTTKQNLRECAAILQFYSNIDSDFYDLFAILFH